VLTNMQSESGPTAVLERLRRVIDGHDLDVTASFPRTPIAPSAGTIRCARTGPRSSARYPTSRRRCASEGDTAWAEWEWTGTRADGAPFALRGTTIQCVRHGLVSWVRLYMEPVQEGGGGADEGVRQSLAGR
jgi:hypothetical protein